MIEILEQMPNQFFEFSDDNEAKMLLHELGLISRFSKKPDVKPSAAQVLTHGDHPTHFIAAFYFSGKDKPEDNGYLVFCLPKSMYSPQQAMDFVKQKAQGQGECILSKYVPSDSSFN